MPIEPILLPMAVLLARTIPLVELTPFLGTMPLPRVVKLAFAVGLAAMLAPLLGPITPANILALLVVEASIGLTLGFLGSLVFEAASMAGALIDRSVAPPSGEGPFERGYGLLAVAVFLLLGGHHVWLDAVAVSYALFPAGVPHVESAIEVGRTAAAAIGLAVVLALPAIATALIVDVLLAVLRRSSRSLHSLLAEVPLRALAVTCIAALSFGIVATQLGDVLIEAMSALEAFRVN